MGALRLFLALSVIAGHSQSTVFGFNGIGAWYAVNFFFIISGFYMAMILNEKYKEKNPMVFYTNRILKLFPTYYIGLIISLVVSFGAIINFFDSLSFSGSLFYIFQNLFILGQDISYIANVSTNNNGNAPAVYMTINPPAWSLSVELMFYLIAPFFLKNIRGTFMLFFIGIVYLLFIKHGLVYPIGSSDFFRNLLITDLNYYFNPSSLVFFGAGALSYHLFKQNNQQNNFIVYALSIVSLILMAYTETIMPFWHLFLISLAIPILFELTKNNKLDRLVGELSFPTYILHFPILLFYKDTIFIKLEYFNFLTIGSYVAITSLIIGLVIHYIIENRINLYRQSSILNLNFKISYVYYLKILVFVYIFAASLVLYKLYQESHDSSKLVVFNLSDINWKNGVSIQHSNGFFIQNTNKDNVQIGNMLKFNTGLRKVIDIKKSEQFINIYVDGNRLDPLLDGYPNIVKVVKE